MSWSALSLTMISDQGRRSRPVVIHDVIVAGWTGRDREAMEKHIVELEALGVPRPTSTPIFYRVAATRLTNADEIQVTGNDSSGEVELVLTSIGGRLWVGVGSDHTDRKAETFGITLSKQMCEKPVGNQFWPYDELADHWDSLILRSYIHEPSGDRVVYQEGPVSNMLHPLDLVSRYCGNPNGLTDGMAMFCGTLAAKGGIRSSERFEFSLYDPIKKREITHAYNVVVLPVAEAASASATA